MGQFLSNLYSCCIWGKANDDGDKEELQRPSTDETEIISSQRQLISSPDHSDYYSLPWSSSTSSSISAASCIVSVTYPNPVAQVNSTASVSLYKNLLSFPESVGESCFRAHTFQALHQDLLFSSSCSNELEEEEEEEGVIRKELLVKKEIKWIKHYNSGQQILLVGEGDFSFSASLAVAFGYATNIIATSLNTAEYLSRNYGRALSNIQTLKSKGAKVMHSVDATEMAKHFSFQGMSFNRIVFNFPHSGVFSDKSRELQLRKHRKLVRLFMANAKKMITEMGEIHITHKSYGFFREWNLEKLASREGLRLIEEVHFNYTDYPGYRTKFGFGGDKNFNCNPSKTYKFGLRCHKSWV